jgi:hypothetical protein
VSIDARGDGADSSPRPRTAEKDGPPHIPTSGGRNLSPVEPGKRRLIRQKTGVLLRLHDRGRCVARHHESVLDPDFAMAEPPLREHVFVLIAV